MLSKVLARALYRHLLFFSVLFIIASVALGLGLDAYNTIWWWDDMLHMVSGAILAFFGLAIVHHIASHQPLKLTPSFVALFSFCFAMTMAVFWELFEFFVDYFMGMNMQKWNIPQSMILIGRDYQGAGLSDTMSDFVVAFIGTLAGAISVYLVHRGEYQSLYVRMQRALGRSAKSRK